MKTRHVVLQDQSKLNLTLAQLDSVAQALQTQLDRDFTPVWGVRALVHAIDRNQAVPHGAWPMRILDQSQAGLGVHLDNHGKPFAEIEAGTDWTITASHELLEMLVDPLGKKLISDKDIDPASDGHQVQYLVEVGDPVEVFAYQINGVSLSDFITPEYYDLNAAPGTSYDFLNQLQSALEVPAGCYISWFDPQDGRWHQKQPDGSFITAQAKANFEKNPRDERDAAFTDDENATRHDQLRIRSRYNAAQASRKAAGQK
ncbi:MAG TPA: hypothetical protein VNH19_24740 [Candidatus Limnocylindrales bacterium]|nr:hypothetical protein [Candidatus Limnocylindrales bacterium]